MKKENFRNRGRIQVKVGNLACIFWQRRVKGVALDSCAPFVIMPCQVIPVLYNDVFYYREKVKVVSRPLDIKLYNTLSPTLSKGGVDSNGGVMC